MAVPIGTPLKDSSFVHSSRLQYIEFFGKFYEAGGKAFVPLAIRTKYMNVTK
ncbi:MAG: hypothetical protein II433_09545 [Acidaminococcaceae bacterium]|nr:hypothetical protein [Acidaminococcaceae bacterium]